MPFYHKLGELPLVKHTTFYQPDGKSLYREELISSKGFSGIYSNKYHIHMPTSMLRIGAVDLHKDVAWPEALLTYYHCFTDDRKSGGDFISSRDAYVANPHCVIAAADVTENSGDFYRNAYAAEYIFVHHGTGMFYSEFGKMPFEEGDQIIVPRAVTYRMEFNSLENNKLLIVESDTAYEIPNHFHSQIEEHAPYSERDFNHCGRQMIICPSLSVLIQ